MTNAILYGNSICLQGAYGASISEKWIVQTSFVDLDRYLSGSHRISLARSSISHGKKLLEDMRELLFE